MPLSRATVIGVRRSTVPIAGWQQSLNTFFSQKLQKTKEPQGSPVKKARQEAAPEAPKVQIPVRCLKLSSFSIFKKKHPKCETIGTVDRRTLKTIALERGKSCLSYIPFGNFKETYSRTRFADVGSHKVL